MSNNDLIAEIVDCVDGFERSVNAYDLAPEIPATYGSTRVIDYAHVEGMISELRAILDSEDDAGAPEEVA